MRGLKRVLGGAQLFLTEYPPPQAGWLLRCPTARNDP